MLRLSRLADYAVVILLKLGCADVVQTSSGIAAATGVPEPTVAKVLKMLAAAGLATSMRGARGGYLLGRPLTTVSVAEVITAVDGPIALTSCVDGAPAACDVSGMCALHGHWHVVNDAIRAALEAISLAELRAAQPRFTHDTQAIAHQAPTDEKLARAVPVAAA